MRITSTLVLATLAASATGQIQLVDAAGTPFPVSTVTFPSELPPPPPPPLVPPYYTMPLSLAPNGKVYLALPASLPSGYYMFDVLNVLDISQSVSQLSAEDRVFYAANNGAAGFALTRVSNTPSLPGLGDGVGGVGDAMPVFDIDSPLPIPGRPDLECIQKVVVYSLGASPTGALAYVDAQHFRIGNGSPGSVTGTVFEDFNQNGVRDAGEPGVGGCPVQLVSDSPATPGQIIASTSTAANGSYLFSPVGYEPARVVLVLNTQLYIATTPTDVGLSNCGCGNQGVDFGKYTIPQPCNARTIGFWRNCHGIQIIHNGSYWDELAALNLVDGCGHAYNPTGGSPFHLVGWFLWLRMANSHNMAYMLSAQLAAMQLNVLAGYVHPQCWVQTSQGPMTVEQLMVAANAALAADAYTPNHDPNRIVQRILKNALDAANNNLNWL
ncbi:MAG: SdrD B-like domain-containing protein [Planctomycetota bacterium]